MREWMVGCVHAGARTRNWPPGGSGRPAPPDSFAWSRVEALRTRRPPGSRGPAPPPARAAAPSGKCSVRLRPGGRRGRGSPGGSGTTRPGLRGAGRARARSSPRVPRTRASGPASCRTDLRWSGARGSRRSLRAGQQALGTAPEAGSRDCARDGAPGTAELLPLSAFLSPTEPGGAMSGSHAGEEREPPREGAPGGAPQHSLHLTALVQLVKEIPGFLFGEVSPESRGASLDGERVSPEVAHDKDGPGLDSIRGVLPASGLKCQLPVSSPSSPTSAVAVETCPLRGLLSCLPDTPVSQPSLATMSSGRSSCSGSPGARGQGSPLPIRTANTLRPAEEEDPGAPGREHSTPACSPGRRKSHRKQERGTSGADPTGTSPGNSPLQGLINCLKEILVPGPQQPDASPSLPPPVPSLGASQLSRVALGPGSPPWGVKTEAASGDCPLQGLLNCLKDIPTARDTRPSPSGSGDPRLQKDPGAWKRNSGGLPTGPRPLQTSPPCPGPGAVVKMEDGWAQSPPVPASCQLGKRTHSPSPTGSLGGDGDTSGVRMPSWGPTAQAGSASSSPLEALEACLKGIPLSGSLPPQPLATSWFRSPQLGDPGSQRPELQPRGSRSQEVTVGPLLALGLQGFVRDSPALPPGPHGTPTSFSSSSSTDGDLDFQSPEGSQGRWRGKGGPVGSSPLQGLENCLREIPVPRSQPAWSWSSAGDRVPRRAEPKNWTADKEGRRGEACEPVHLGRRGGDVPTRSLRPASPQVLASSSVPACCQQGLRDPVATRPGPWRWLQEGAATMPSPLHCLENSLKGILPGRPLRFACLASPSPGPSPSSGSSSSSSFSSSEEDLRLEPKLWQAFLQERDPLPSSKGPGPPSPRSGGTPAGSSTGEGPGKAEPRDHFSLSAGKAEEKMEGMSQSPRRDACVETPGRPGLGTTQGEAVGSPGPALRPEKGPRLGPCQPPGSEPGPPAWKPRVSEESGGLGPGHGGPSDSARTETKPLPRGLPGPPPAAAALPALPPASPRPPCPCGNSLQQELHSLSATLSEKLDQLAMALAGLSQEVATMRTQVHRLGRRPWGAGSKGQASWPRALPRGPHWAPNPANRHLPYRRQKGPTRLKPKILRGQAEGCRAGGTSGLSHGTPHLGPQLSPDAHLAEPSGSGSSPSQQPPYSACSRAMLTVHPPLGHTGGHQSPPPPSVPAAFPPQMASPATSADAEPPAAAAAPTGTRNWPKDPNGLLAGVQRALKVELWDGEHRDLRWGAPDCLHQLSPAKKALPPAATPRGWPAPLPHSSRTFPISGP
ncbi:protein KRBA1 isoform X4 [Rhinolophus sinicus]|uniref:protein KRBA1 isoform X4 n=1 Tax=Rhinolophus sinicus TaxID=89399 RepID=UPI003D7937A1